MTLYTIGDTHLSLGCDKPMEIFSGWDHYVQRLEQNWRAKVKPEDTVVVAGDISWAISLPQSLADFQFLHSLPGKKILLKGNHDYWWSTRNKMEHFFSENGLNSLFILHNNCVPFGPFGICGTRGWIFENGEAQDAKVLARETGRLEASLADCVRQGLTPLVFLHYPPLYGSERSKPILDTLLEFQVRRCFYGHLHGSAIHAAFLGPWHGIEMSLVSCDFLRFDPVLVESLEEEGAPPA